MGHAAAMGPEPIDLGGVRMHHVREPDIVADPVVGLRIFHRGLAELRTAVVFLVARFGQVGVHGTPQARARRAVSRMRSVETENGEHGASTIRVIAPSRSSW